MIRHTDITLKAFVCKGQHMVAVVQNFSKKIGLIRLIQLSGFNQIIGLVQTDNQCFFQLSSVQEEWQKNKAISDYIINTCDIYIYI